MRMTEAICGFLRKRLVVVVVAVGQSKVRMCNV